MAHSIFDDIRSALGGLANTVGQNINLAKSNPQGFLQGTGIGLQKAAAPITNFYNQQNQQNNQYFNNQAAKFQQHVGIAPINPNVAQNYISARQSAVKPLAGIALNSFNVLSSKVNPNSKPINNLSIGSLQDIKPVSLRKTIGGGASQGGSVASSLHLPTQVGQIAGGALALGNLDPRLGGGEAGPGGLLVGRNAKGFEQAVGKFSALHDRMPRFEISDQAFKVIGGALKKGEQAFGGLVRSAKLGDLIKHEELFKQYPELRDLRVIETPHMPANTEGVTPVGGGHIQIAPNLSPSALKNTLIHEIQHVIQEKEGFSPGTMPSLEPKDHALMNELESVKAAYLQKFNTAQDANQKSGYARQIGSLNRNIQTLKQKAFKTYSQTPGEVESRSAADRLNLNSEQRMQIDPYANQGPVGKVRVGQGTGSGSIAEPGLVEPPKQISGVQKFLNRARNVIASQGPEGQQISQMLQSARDLKETYAGQLVSQLQGPLKKLSKNEFQNFVDVSEGNAQPVSTKVAEAAKVWDSVRQDIFSKSTQLGSEGEPLLNVGKVENYFPHRFDQAMFADRNKYNEALKHLVDSGQAPDMGQAIKMLNQIRDFSRNRRFGNLEMSRVANLPGYEKTPDALLNYIEGAAGRISQAHVYGPKDEKVMDLIGRIADNGGDAGTVKDMFDIAIGAKKYGTTSQKVSGALRGYNATTKLGLGAVTNIGQSVNTATVTGIRSLLKSLPTALSQEGKDYALKAGVTLDGVISDMKEAQGFGGKVLGKITAPGFNTVEKFNRTLAAIAGRDYARNAAKSGNTRILESLGLNANEIASQGGKLTPDQEVQAARKIVERTQFKVDPQDLPGWSASPWGKLLTQFKSFSYNQSAFMKREVLDPARRGDVRPLIRFVAIGLPVGAGLKGLKDRLNNRDPEENPAKRALQAFGQVGGLGLAQDVATGLIPQNGKYLPADRAVSLALSTLGGPTVGNIAEGYGGLAQAIQGKPESLERFALRQAPIVGSRLQNTLLPYGPKTETVTQKNQPYFDQAGLQGKQTSQLDQQEKDLAKAVKDYRGLMTRRLSLWPTRS
jgi:hypothetical protein